MEGAPTPASAPKKRSNRITGARMGFPGYIFNDGGRKALGLYNLEGDCVVRAISIAFKRHYRDVYQELQKMQNRWDADQTWGRSIRKGGVWDQVYEKYMSDNGWERARNAGRTDNLPLHGRYILEINKHLMALINGNIQDDLDHRYEQRPHRNPRKPPVMTKIPRRVYAIWSEIQM